MIVSKDLSNEERLKLVSFICESYLKSKKRMGFYDYVNVIRINKNLYEGDKGMVYLVEHSLAECTETTQMIIKNDFLEKKETEWYYKYFSRSVYYRLRKEAVDEFLHHLDI